MLVTDIPLGGRDAPPYIEHDWPRGLLPGTQTWFTAMSDGRGNPGVACSVFFLWPR